jgi:hypothetical protein
MMKIHEKDDLTWDGRSVWFSGPNEQNTPGGDSYLWMCAQDLGTEIWAQFDRLERRCGRDHVEPVRVENCSPSLLQILIDSVPFNDYREDLSAAVSNFAKLVAQEFVLRGLLLFELQGGWNTSTDISELEAATLELIPRDYVVRLSRWAFQVVPAAMDAPHSMRRIIPLDRSRLFAFMPPHRWRRALTRIRAGLPIVGHSEQRWMMIMGRQRASEDFKTVNLAYSVQRARLTAAIGWNARGLYVDHIADFHSTMRELRWKRFCIEARDAILTKLREVFELIGSWKGEHPRLIWEHLPTVKQVEEGEAKIMGKGEPFDEVLRLFRYSQLEKSE